MYTQELERDIADIICNGIVDGLIKGEDNHGIPTEKTINAIAHKIAVKIEFYKVVAAFSQADRFAEMLLRLGKDMYLLEGEHIIKVRLTDENYDEMKRQLYRNNLFHYADWAEEERASRKRKKSGRRNSISR